MLTLSDITKSFAGRTAVDHVSFKVAAGEVVGFLGPNGAGKTTTMRMIAGITEPDSGTILCGGHDMWTHRIEAQSLIGYLTEGAPLYGEMTALSYLGFMCETRGIAKAARGDMIASAVTRTSLDEVLQRPIDTLSKGFRRRVALAGLGRPDCNFSGSAVFFAGHFVIASAAKQSSPALVLGCFAALAMTVQSGIFLF